MKREIRVASDHFPVEEDCEAVLALLTPQVVSNGKMEREIRVASDHFPSR